MPRRPDKVTYNPFTFFGFDQLRVTGPNTGRRARTRQKRGQPIFILPFDETTDYYSRFMPSWLITRGKKK